MEPLTFVIYVLGYCVCFYGGWYDLHKIYRCTKARAIFLAFFSLGSWISAAAVGVSIIIHKLHGRG